MDQKNIRNFAIIAHIDHGKSTLADRLMEMTGTVAKREMQEQLLDSNPIERERGITIKLAPVRMKYNPTNPTNNPIRPIESEEYILNLIDTPGHVDFSYEVSRSLAACEGAILVIDATQGVQAQTLANLRLAREHNLKIIPVINKVDLPNARIDYCINELDALGFAENEIIPISAKTGTNVDRVLEAIVELIPSPLGNPSTSLRALVFSSHYDTHKGVVCLVRVVDGEIAWGSTKMFFGDARSISLPAGRQALNSSKIPYSLSDISSPQELINSEKSSGRTVSAPQNTLSRPSVKQLKFLASGATVTPIEIGYFSPKMIACDALRNGEVGYIATGLKDVRLAKVGDTITTVEDRRLKMGMDDRKSKVDKTDQSSIFDPQSLSSTLNHLPSIQPLPGYKEPKPMVFLGLFPLDSSEYQTSREAMDRLRLSDSAFTFRPISSLALGNGFHCGFLGLLHAEIVQERLLREFNLSILATSPSVEYHVTLKPNTELGKLGFTQNHLVSELDQLTVAIQSATELPDPTYIDDVKEPVMQVTIFSPKQYVGAIMQLCQEKRGEYVDLKYFNVSDQARLHSPSATADGGQAEFTYLIPLSDMIIDFFDRLKSVTEGYASLDYEFFEYQKVDVSKVDILVNHEKVDALSFLVVTDQAEFRSRQIVEKLSEAIPRQQFNIPIQGAIGGRVIARADVKAFRKDVIQKLYGGDRSRKDKLLDKQKKGKAKMKMIGRVEIPQQAFFSVLKQG